MLPKEHWIVEKVNINQPTSSRYTTQGRTKIHDFLPCRFLFETNSIHRRIRASISAAYTKFKDPFTRTNRHTAWMEKQGLTEASGVLNTGDFDQRYWEVTSGPIPRFLCKLRVDVPLHSIVNRERLNQCVYRFIPLISPFVECLACLRTCVGAGGWVCDPDIWCSQSLKSGHLSGTQTLTERLWNYGSDQITVSMFVR